MNHLDQLYAELRATRAVQAHATDSHTWHVLEGECAHISEAIEHELRVQEIDRKYATARAS